MQMFDIICFIEVTLSIIHFIGIKISSHCDMIDFKQHKLVSENSKKHLNRK